MTSEMVVRLDKISKRFAGHTAVNALELVVPKASVYGLLGPNGAGKTTTIRMIMNIIAPDAGRVELFGSAQSGRSVAHRIGYLPEERGLYRKMKVVELLVFLAQIKGVEHSKAKSHVARR
jgi:ABC-2 type transport system ATP-binding protein